MRHTDRTWDLLTPRMQDASTGRDGYDSFWKAIDRVNVNQTLANAADRKAVVSLTFTYKDGTMSTGTHELTFVTHDEDYPLDSDQLIG